LVVGSRLPQPGAYEIFSLDGSTELSALCPGAPLWSHHA
jgi:hypothetical protein